MIIKRFHLEAFGPFTDASLEFDSAGPGLHIVFGPNESGKSSTLRALKAWLFGFPERTADNFLHANDRLCVSGTLSDGQGGELVFSRRKKRKGSVLDPGGNVLDQGLIRAWLQGLDREGFETLFGLDHSGLVKGGASILQEKGSAGTTLFSAGTGIASVERILSDLQEERREIFKPQGSKPRLNAALKRFRELKREINQAALSSHAWKEQERALRRAEWELARTRDRKKKVQEKEQRLQRLQQALQPLARLREARAGLERLGSLPSLPDDFAGRRQENQELLRQSERTLSAAGKRLAEYKAKIESIEPNTELLDQAETIHDLHQRLGAYRKGVADRRGLENSRLQEEAAAAAILRRVRPDLDTDRVEDLGTLLRQRREISAHGNKLGLLQKESLDSARALESSQEELADKKAELKKLPPDRDLSALDQALDQAAGLGDIDAALEQQAARAAREKEDFSAGLKRLGFWRGSPEELLRLPMPLETAVRQFKQAWADLEQEGRELDKTREELSARIAELKKDIHSQELVGEVPSEEELKEKRAWREKGWSILRRKWFEAEDVEAEAKAYASEETLSQVYERAVQAADHTADRLRWESSRVHENARLHSELEQARRQWAELERAGADLSGKWRELQAGWSRAWQACGLEPDTPEVMSDWQGEIRQWRVTARQILQNEAAVAELGQKRREARGLLEKALRETGLPIPGGEALSPVLGLAKKKRQEIEQIAHDRRAVLVSISRLEKESVRAGERARQADEALESWQRQWAAYLSRLGLPGTETPDGVSDFFEDLEVCLKHVNNAAGYSKRIQGIDQDSRELGRDLNILLQRAAPELAGLPLDQAVESLNGLLDRAQADATSLQNYRDSIARTEKEIQEAAIDREQAVSELAELCALAGCEDQAELEAVEQRWRKGQELEKIIRTEEAGLREIAGSCSLDELAAEVQALDPDSLPVSLKETAEELERLEEAFGEQSAMVGEMRKSFQDMDGSDYAARKAEEAEEVLAVIRRQAEHFTRLRLAGLVLEEAVERYRAENQDPVLALAGEYFTELTLGSFQGLRTDVDDKGEQIIVGLREAGQRIPVEGMSDGSRDQLFLALRLASLEYRLQKSEPVPFIVDDILINFDEDRTRAALKALARLGEKNQVLLFSHHRQVAEAGRELNLGRVHLL
ncbi:MAG: AAA family ATPase [Desulfohalobiaceae bacterium]|nr:AAA family ATPase [Desulfohalobiaceae bacterium]